MSSPSEMADAVRTLRPLILADEHYRQVLANATGLGTTESQALSSLAVHGDSGQTALARDLDLTGSASTALVDRLERQGAGERVRHPRDRRRATDRLTERGLAMITESQRWLAGTVAQVDEAELENVSASLAFIAETLQRTTSRGAEQDWADSPTRRGRERRDRPAVIFRL